MSNFTRKETISKSSGPIHSNSYAMRGVPVRYKNPIYVPDLLKLPVSWTKPTLPSSSTFFYDYSTERKVVEQAKDRAIFIAAETSLQRKHVLKLQQQQKQTSTSNDNSSVAIVDTWPQRGAPCLPVLSGTDILTPTPVAPTSTITSTVGRGVNSGSGNPFTSPAVGPSNASESSSSLLGDNNVKKSPPATDNSSSATANDKMDATIFKSLGNWSIKDFEGDTMDPFEIASLQAINDMEELQSVLQPTPVVTGTGSVLAGSSSAANTLVQTGVVSTSQLPSLSPPTSSSSPSFHAAALSMPAVPVAVVSTVSSHLVTPIFTSTVITSSNSTGVGSGVGGSTVEPSLLSSKSSPLLMDAVKQSMLISGTGTSADTNSIIRQNNNPPSSTSPSCQFQQQLHQQVPQAAVSGCSFVARGNAAVPSQVALASTNPFSDSALFKTNPFRNSIEIEIAQSGSYPFIPVSSNNSNQQQPQSQPGIATLVDLGVIVTNNNNSHPVPAPRGTPRMMSPVPVPRKKSASGDMPTTSSSTGGAVLPPLPVPQPSPDVRLTRATGSGSTTFTPPSHGRLGEIGIAVLPSIPPPKLLSSSSSTLQPKGELPPPAYKKRASPLSPSSKVSPPPPYSSPSTNQQQHPQATASPVPRRPPRVSPKSYSLPDPEVNLTAEQKAQMKTIAGMGFPQQRVGRAVLRFKDDQTKVLDFLFMVGKLEDVHFNGESAETALSVCQDDLEKAKEYLQKLEAYKEFGFHEKAVHEAYTKAKADWNEALDILTRDR